MPNLMQDSIRDFSITIVKSILENKILWCVVKNTRKTKGTQLKKWNGEKVYINAWALYIFYICKNNGKNRLNNFQKVLTSANYVMTPY